MSLESWKDLFEIGGVVLVLLTFFCGAGALIANHKVNAKQARELNDFKVKIEQEQQKTAEAQTERDALHLKLDHWLAGKVMSRIATGEGFEQIKKLPKARAVVLYKEEDGEAFMYAQSILQALRGIGWDVPDTAVATRIHPMTSKDDIPIIGQYVIARSIPEPKQMFPPENSRSRTAMLMVVTHANGVAADPTLSGDEYRIVVGEYYRFWEP
jgi:hypothetical protein